MKSRIAPSGVQAHGSNQWKRFFSKRNLECIHLILWTTKDLAWILVWPKEAILALGIMVLSMSCFEIFRDIFMIGRSFYKKESSVRTLGFFREFTSTITVSFWVLGNMTWAYGEVWDLATTCTYGEIYELYLAYAIYFLWFSCIIWMLYIPVVVFGEGLALGPWYETRLMAVKMDTVINDLRETGNLDGEVVAAALRDQGFSAYGGELYGMPYMGDGLMLLKSGRENVFNLGTTISKTRAKWVSGMFSFRDFELAVMLFWTFKDLSWVYEDTVYGTLFWCFGALFAMQATFKCFTSMLVYKQGSSEVVYALATFMWVLGNVVWGFGEMFMPDGTEDDDLGFIELYPDPVDRIEAFVPGLFIAPSKIPPGAWATRFYGGWILMLTLVMLGLYHLSMLIMKFTNKSSTSGSVHVTSVSELEHTRHIEDASVSNEESSSGSKST